MVGVVEQVTSKAFGKAAKDEVGGKYFQFRKYFQVRNGSKDEVGRKRSKEEIGPPWKGLCTGQLLTAEVTENISQCWPHVPGR